MNSRWMYSTTYQTNCQVIDSQSLWGDVVCRIWLPHQDAVVRVYESDLTPMDMAENIEVMSHHISYVAAAAKISETVEGESGLLDANILLAPMMSNVIPLPHQIYALSRAMSSNRIRYLLADEVGLGKTIEAGLILRELKLRGLVKRTLIVAPKSLAIQWIAEMETHFNESFSLVNPSDLEVLERLNGNVFGDKDNQLNISNPWLNFSQAIVTLDSVKPISKRRGWSSDKVDEYNRKRYESLIQAGWDLIIVDESHRLGGSSENVARYKLGKGLSEAAPYLLLLSATPHQGKSDAFHRLMSMLDPMMFPDEESVNQDQVSEYVIRTEKRKSITAEGEPLFRPRVTETIDIDLSKSNEQTLLYEAVTDYVKRGYNKALKDKKPHIGFLMVLLQRITTSSSEAIYVTLKKRLEVLKLIKESHHLWRQNEYEDDLLDMDGQSQLDMLVEVDDLGVVDEVAEVETLLALAKNAVIEGPDIKTKTLLNLIYKLEAEENEEDLKVLVFTEFVATQLMLKDYLEARGISCVLLNGSMTMDERRLAQQDFSQESRVLISTDAGGEGLNLQFCHIVINYDLPWNPMRIEQRIGRVDRIGQKKIVKAINFVYQDSVENRVRDVLHEKLAVILKDLGVDKTSDILDTSLSGEVIEDMMTQVIMTDSDINEKADEAIGIINEELLKNKQISIIHSISENPDISLTQKVKNHPLPYWIERMTISYLKMKKSEVTKGLLGWTFTWPNGESVKDQVFYTEDNTQLNKVLSLENPKILKLVGSIPKFVPGQPIHKVQVTGLPSTINGYWGLFEIKLTIQNAHYNKLDIPAVRKSYIPVFISRDNKVFNQTARAVWNQLLTSSSKLLGIYDSKESREISDLLISTSIEEGVSAYEYMKAAHAEVVRREGKRGNVAFNARRHAIEKLGLKEVRDYRLNKVDQEEKDWEERLKTAGKVLPEINPLIMLHINQEYADV